MLPAQRLDRSHTLGVVVLLVHLKEKYVPPVRERDLVHNLAFARADVLPQCAAEGRHLPAPEPQRGLAVRAEDDRQRLGVVAVALARPFRRCGAALHDVAARPLRAMAVDAAQRWHLQHSGQSA